MSKTNILAKALQICFVSYGVNENKTLKLQLQNLFNFINEETEEAINDLINNFDCFSEHDEQWEWFKQQAFNLINKKLW